MGWLSGSGVFGKCNYSDCGRHDILITSSTDHLLPTSKIFIFVDKGIV